MTVGSLCEGSEVCKYMDLHITVFVKTYSQSYGEMSTIY